MATQAMAPRADNPIAMFQGQLESRAREIQSALPAHISPDKFQRTVMTAVAQNPDLLKADRQSLILSCYKAAQDALLPDGREAALVTFNTRFKDPQDNQWKNKKLVQYMPMVYGLRKKILQSGDVVSLEVNVIYRAEVEKGTFLYEVGLEPPLRHRPSLDLNEEETGDEEIIGAYSIATMKDGTKSYEIMRRFEINKVREASQTGSTKDRKGEPKEAKGPWVDWFAEMAKKTVMRRHAKTLPMSGDLLIDVEGRDLDVGMASARALGSTAPDAPQLEDQSEDTPHDPQTGEVLEDAADETADEQANDDGEREPTPAETVGLDPEPKAKAKKQTPPPAEEPPVEQASDEPHPAQAMADKLIGEIKSAMAIMDVNTIVTRAQLDIAAMPDAMAEAIESAAQARRDAIRAERATVGAK